MNNLKILNAKEVKEINALLAEQWGCMADTSYAFLRNSKNRIFLVNREIAEIDLSRLRINSIGMYFCELDEKGIRLSIEGSQLLGPNATKNIVELDEQETAKWFKGEDIKKECNGCSGFLLVRNKNDFLGAGKYSKGTILNYVGKTRRINVHD